MVGALLYALCLTLLRTGSFIEHEVRLIANKLTLAVLLCPVPKLWGYWHHLTMPDL